MNAFKIMWLFVMFDLPMTTRSEKKRYTRFVSGLKRRAFSRLQFSIYARPYSDERAASSARLEIKGEVPPGGNVRLLSVTDHQFGKMDSFLGTKRVEIEKPLGQIELF